MPLLLLSPLRRSRSALSIAPHTESGPRCTARILARDRRCRETISCTIFNTVCMCVSVCAYTYYIHLTLYRTILCVARVFLQGVSRIGAARIIDTAILMITSQTPRAVKIFNLHNTHIHTFTRMLYVLTPQCYRTQR